MQGVDIFLIFLPIPGGRDSEQEAPFLVASWASTIVLAPESQRNSKYKLNQLRAGIYFTAALLPTVLLEPFPIL